MQTQREANQKAIAAQQQWGTAEGQRRAAEIQGASAWTKGLGSLVDKGMQGLETGFKMSQDKARLAEEQKTGEANRAMLMENTLAAQQRRALDAQFAAKERQAGLAGTEASTAQTIAGTKGQEIINQASQIDLQAKQTKQAFLNADAQTAGFQGARPGESVEQYGFRMDQEGKVNESRRVAAEANKMEMEAKFMPERLRLEKLQTLASIEASKANAAASRTSAQVMLAQDRRAAEQFVLQNYQAKAAQVEAEVDNYMQFLKGTNYDQNQKTALTIDFLNKSAAKFNLPADQQALQAGVGRAIAKQSAAEQAAMMNNLTMANIHPGMKQGIEEATRTVNLANRASELIAGLTQDLNKYKTGAGVIRNSQEAKDAAANIQVKLDMAAANDPVFKPYADRFREINAGLWQLGLKGGESGWNALFGPSTGKLAEGLIERMKQDISTQLKANKHISPMVQQFVDTNSAMVNFQKQGNIFYQAMSNPKGMGQLQQNAPIPDPTAQPTTPLGDPRETMGFGVPNPTILKAGGQR